MEVDEYVNGSVPQLDMPGGDDFRDITVIFGEASRQMEQGSMLMMEGFELQQAMNAFEIGEPRLDTGVISEQDAKPPFNALEALLPSEVCWIMDRSFACEMLWHIGNCLPHSVLTIQYVHHLPDMDPDFLYLRSQSLARDPSRPIELLTIVLRAFMSGLMKSCDLAWRRLNEGSTREIEDWQPDKCEVSFLEGVPPSYLLTKLEEADFWLSKAPEVCSEWREPLRVRLMLRNTLLQLLALDIHKDLDKFQSHITSAKQLLSTIRANPSPEPIPGSPALLAFDPHLPRLLICSVPLRILDIPPIADVWQTLDHFLDDWSDIANLSITHSLTTWDMAGTMMSYLGAPTPPFLRSTAQMIIYDGFLVLHKFTPSWVIERFFFETMGVRYHILNQAIRDNWKGADPPPFPEMERQFIRLITPHLQNHWLNAPRRRRSLSKSLLPWHKLYDLMLEILDNVDTSDDRVGPMLLQMPVAVLSCRLNTIREVVLSGFQLDLYTPEERAFAYLYVARVAEVHLSCLDSLNAVVPEKTLAKAQIASHMQYLTALQLICTALFPAAVKLMTFNLGQLQANHLRRYKWAFRPEYDSIASPAIASPDIAYLVPSCKEVSENTEFSPSDSISHAKMLLSSLATDQSSTGRWQSERAKFLHATIDVCDSLMSLPSSSVEMRTFDAALLLWDPAGHHPWFPILSEQGAEARRKRMPKPESS